MTIQRFSAYHSGDPHKVGMWKDPEGHWVQYEDHLAAIEEALAERQVSLSDGRDRGR